MDIRVGLTQTDRPAALHSSAARGIRICSVGQYDFETTWGGIPETNGEAFGMWIVDNYENFPGDEDG